MKKRYCDFKLIVMAIDVFFFFLITLFFGDLGLFLLFVSGKSEDVYVPASCAFYSDQTKFIDRLLIA